MFDKSFWENKYANHVQKAKALEDRINSGKELWFNAVLTSHMNVEKAEAFHIWLKYLNPPESVVKGN